MAGVHALSGSKGSHSDRTRDPTGHHAGKHHKRAGRIIAAAAVAPVQPRTSRPSTRSIVAVSVGVTHSNHGV